MGVTRRFPGLPPVTADGNGETRGEIGNNPIGSDAQAREALAKQKT